MMKIKILQQFTMAGFFQFSFEVWPAPSAFKHLVSMLSLVSKCLANVYYLELVFVDTGIDE